MNTTNDQPAADYATLRILTDNQAEDIERLHAKIANQAERIRHLEGATNHATGTPLSQAQAKIAALETQLEAHAWTISLATAQAKIAELEKLADCAFVALKQAEGNLTGFDCKGSTIEVVRRSIKELAARKEGQP